MEQENLSVENPIQENPAPKGSLNYWLIAVAVLASVLLFDQIFKIWIKTTMDLNTEKHVLGNWFLLHFTENPGMAFGLELGGKYGKLMLTLFRIIAVGFGFWILAYQIKKRVAVGFIVCIALIIAGAIGNIIDSVFYGVIFEDINRYSGGWMHGRVVDMLYFPLIEGHYPNWVPWKGGDYFIFFSPVFNIADAAISTGVIAILVFQKKFFPPEEEIPKTNLEANNEIKDDFEADFIDNSEIKR